jgi:hypothetical protein
MGRRAWWRGGRCHTGRRNTGREVSNYQRITVKYFSGKFARAPKSIDIKPPNVRLQKRSKFIDIISIEFTKYLKGPTKPDLFFIPQKC